jgi:hypothetical protein
MPPRGRGRRAKLGVRGGKSYSTVNEAQSPAMESSQGTQPEDNTEEIPDELMPALKKLSILKENKS